MVWSKVKQNLESFLSPVLVERVEYRPTGYRYLPDKNGRCYIVADKKEVFNLSDRSTNIQWYQTEQEIKNDPKMQITITKEDIEMMRKEKGANVPEERLIVIARDRKLSIHAKELMLAQVALCKSDFYTIANAFLSDSIENNLESKDILLNVMALIDRRVGKKRLLGLAETIKLKHPIVQFFYELRCTLM